MDAAAKIRIAVARVAAIRQDAAMRPELQTAIIAVKAFQASRFAGTYGDLLSSVDFGAAARFFLNDLYSDKDYSSRDAQFSRIAGALQRLFPQQVIATAVSLAELHLLTEELDRQMAYEWATHTTVGSESDRVAGYIRSWRTVGRMEDRTRQLEMVLTVGCELDRLTRTPGLRLMLRMMRGPAKAAGLGSLQSFLEAGFDIFASMSGNGRRALEFLNTIRERESVWIQRLTNGDLQLCQSDLLICCQTSVH